MRVSDIVVCSLCRTELADVKSWRSTLQKTADLGLDHVQITAAVERVS
jgi:hypothetical protein